MEQSGAVSCERVYARAGLCSWESLVLFKREDGFYLHQPFELEPCLSISGFEITQIIDCETVDPAKKATHMKIDVSFPSKAFKGSLYKAFKVVNTYLPRFSPFI